MKPIILLMLAGLCLYWLVYNSELLANPNQPNQPKQTIVPAIEMTADIPISFIHWQQ
ncbi:MAG: hypothetical protein NTZ47_08525 [Bacteroidetes bacterium]|jgi:hypothetical protein|nr:hypothetical protein [Bacteroidota bacterium]